MPLFNFRQLKDLFKTDKSTDTTPQPPRQEEKAEEKKPSEQDILNDIINRNQSGGQQIILAIERLRSKLGETLPNASLEERMAIDGKLEEIRKIVERPVDALKDLGPFDQRAVEAIESLTLIFKYDPEQDVNALLGEISDAILRDRYAQNDLDIEIGRTRLYIVKLKEDRAAKNFLKKQQEEAFKKDKQQVWQLLSIEQEGKRELTPQENILVNTCNNRISHLSTLIQTADADLGYIEANIRDAKVLINDLRVRAQTGSKVNENEIAELKERSMRMTEEYIAKMRQQEEAILREKNELETLQKKADEVIPVLHVNAKQWMQANAQQEENTQETPVQAQAVATAEAVPTPENEKKVQDPQAVIHS